MDYLNKTLRDIRLNLNNAGASLATQQIKYAAEGLTSAITAAVLCDNLIENMELNAKTNREVEQNRDQAYKLIAAYWEDYRMILKDRPVQPETHEKKNGVPTARRIFSEDEKLEAMLEADQYPAGTPDRTRKLEAIATRRGIHVSTLFAWMKERG